MEIISQHVNDCCRLGILFQMTGLSKRSAAVALSGYLTTSPGVITTYSTLKSCVCRAKLWCGALVSFGTTTLLPCGRRRRSAACYNPASSLRMHIHVDHEKLAAQSARNAAPQEYLRCSRRKRMVPETNCCRAYVCSHHYYVCVLQWTATGLFVTTG